MAARTFHVVVMVLLFTAAAIVEALHCSSLSSPFNSDVWWHLSTGLWILHNHALPHSGVFSQFPDRPWIASSWLYDLKLAVWYQLAGLRSIVVFQMFFKAALAVIAFFLAGGRRGSFSLAVGLSFVAQYVLGNVQPGPAYCSLVFFGVELLILFHARQSGATRFLWWLPALFCIWANLHIQFVYGIAALILFAAAMAIKSGASSNQTPSIPKVAALSLAAACVTPYFYRPWQVFFAAFFSSANENLPDFHAMSFHQPQDYLLLLLAMFAFLVLGLRRTRDPFPIALLAGAAALSFYSQRDVWVVVLAALAIIGDSPALTSARTSALAPKESGPNSAFENRTSFVAIAVSSAILVLAGFAILPRSPGVLLAKVSQGYPVAACNYIREHQLPQPLFNAFEWGGFVTWALPGYPVAIDGRTDLYGDDYIVEYSKVMNANVRYTEFPALAEARTILLPKTAIMAEALSSVPTFKVAYRDEIALVLTRE